MIESGARGVTEERGRRRHRVRPRGDQEDRRGHRGAGLQGRQDQAHCRLRRSSTRPTCEQLEAKIGDRLKDALDTKKHPKFESYAMVKEIKDELTKELPAGDADANKKLASTTKHSARRSSASR